MPYPLARRLLLALVCATAAGAAAPAGADQYDTLRAKWVAQSALTNQSDPDIATQLATIAAAAQTHWDHLQQHPGREALWPDLADWNTSATITLTFARLNLLAEAYVNGSANQQGNRQLKNAVLSALDWMLAHHYHSQLTAYGNWWDWQIGAPQEVNALLATLYGECTPAQRNAALGAIDHFVPDPTLRTAPDGMLTGTLETGANRLDKAFIVVMRGILGKDGGKIAQGRDAISQTLVDVTAGDGFYADGSFIQHGHVPYVGGYGLVLLSNIARLNFLLNGSPWTLTDANANKPYDWVMRAFRPFIHDGAMMDMQRGRGVTRAHNTDHVIGRATIAAMLRLAQTLPPQQAADIRAMAKGWIQRDATFGPSYYKPQPSGPVGFPGSLAPADIAAIKAVMADDTIPAAQEPVATQVFASADRAVQRRPGHAFGVAMFSDRISAFESGNGENLRGWWTGMGMTYLYHGDQAQYSGNYWATVDMARLAGTTTDHSGGTPVPWRHYSNTGVAGGAQLDGLYAAVGMDFTTANVTGSSLSGKKAWFLFGDYVVAMGSGIRSRDGVPVETIVENRKLDTGGDNPLTIGGKAMPVRPGWAQQVKRARWAHLAGAAPGADIGYVFPDRPVLSGARTRRTSSWRHVDAAGDTQRQSAHYLTLALEHGANPVDGAYTYAVLPNRSVAQVAAFAAHPAFKVLERSTSASAIVDRALGVAGVVFWRDGAKTVHVGGQPYVASDSRSAVVLRQVGDELQLSVADMTQRRQRIEVEVHRGAAALLSSDPAVTVLQLQPTIRLAIDVSGSGGKSYAARFALNLQSNGR